MYSGGRGGGGSVGFYCFLLIKITVGLSFDIYFFSFLHSFAVSLGQNYLFRVCQHC